MSKALEIIRILCGLFIIVSGLMNLGLFGFEPPEAESTGRQFQIAMQELGYFLPIITAIFLASGTAIIADRFGALASLILAPVSVNIFLFHALSGGTMLPVAIVFCVINVYCLWYYRTAYFPLIKSRI